MKSVNFEARLYAVFTILLLFPLYVQFPQ